MSSEYAPDFIERNGAWLLSVLGVLSACVSGMLAYFLRSRCKKIKCCGCECERDVLAIDLERERRQSNTARPLRFLRTPPLPPEGSSDNVSSKE